MPTVQDFLTASVQAVIFTPSAKISIPRVLVKLLPAWADRFSQEPELVNMPGMPEELPRLALKSAVGDWRVEIAPGRTAAIWEKTEKQFEGAKSPPLPEVLENASAMLQEFVGLTEAPVKRLAAVVGRIVFETSPGPWLAAHFCKDRWLEAPFNRPENFELHAHKTYRLDDRFVVNSWVRSKTGALTTPAGPKRVILVEQDVNTLAVEKDGHTFSPSDIGTFFSSVTNGLDQTLSLYYPNESGR